MATPCSIPCPGMETDVTVGNRSEEKTDSESEHSRNQTINPCCDWLISSPVLMYTWGAGSLMTSLQEEAGLDELGVELNPQAVVSG